MPHSCWTCGWNKIDAPTQSEEVDLKNPPTLIGVCWGYLVERGKPMELKANKRKDGRYCADVGCAKWTDIRVDFNSLAGTLAPAEEDLFMAPLQEDL